MMKQTKSFFADFHNADAEGRVRFELHRDYGGSRTSKKSCLRNGQSLIIYSEELEVEGVVHYSQKENLWTAVIDWNAIQEVEGLVPEVPQHISDRTRNVKKIGIFARDFFNNRDEVIN